jgi:hypothetical protein
MNKFRRKEIYVIIRRLLSVIQKGECDKDVLIDILADIEYIQNEEEDYRDNIPENMQGGSRYERSDEACDNMSYACDYIGEATDSDDWVDYLKKAIEHLNDASL